MGECFMKRTALILILLFSSLFLFTGCIGFLFSPSTPGNLQPSNGSTSVQTPITFSWSASTVPFGGQISYDFYLGTESNPAVYAKALTGTSYTVNTLSAGTKYYWKVVAKSSEDKITESFINSFTTKTQSVYRGLTLGLTQYDHFSNLSATDDDADEVEVTFENLSEGYAIQKETGHVTKAEVETWLAAYAAVSQRDDVFVFHYAGHGTYSAGESKMVMSNSTYISMRDLRGYLDQINGTKIVLIDACNSGDFTNLIQGRELTIAERVQQAEQFKQGVLEAFEEDVNARGTHASEFEYYVLTGAAITELSNEDTVLDHGFFTFFFNDGLGNVGVSNHHAAYDGTFNADGYGPGGVSDQNLTFRELYNYSKDKVQDYIFSNYGQTQTVQGNHTDSNFVIGKYVAVTMNK
jgi:hypothetical protein